MNQHLLNTARLFYAVAICDGNLQMAEKQALIEALKDHQKYVRNSGIDKMPEKFVTANQIIRTLAEENLDSRDHYLIFKKFYDAHRSDFSAEHKDLILSLIHRIANSFAKKNKSENILLAKTSLLFNPVSG